jgi:predicted nucleic acid-binding protein
MGVQETILAKKVELAWSYILDFENELNPFEQRRMVVRQWRTQATIDTDETKEIVENAERMVQKGLDSKDALHVACAVALSCDYLLTTDDRLIKKAIGITETKVADPISFIREESE